jgi:transcription elongation factor Elf1
MSDTTTTPGLLLPCPCCGDAEAVINLRLSDAYFTCGSCENEFTADDVRQFITKWSKVLTWVDAMPSE